MLLGILCFAFCVLSYIPLARVLSVQNVLKRQLPDADGGEAAATCIADGHRTHR